MVCWGLWKEQRSIFTFQTKKQCGRKVGLGEGYQEFFQHHGACSHLNQILMTFSRPYPPPPSPKDTMSSNEPQYLQVQRILGQENGDRRLPNACRGSCIRLGSDDCKNKMFGKSCRSPPTPPHPCLFSPHPNSDHPLGHLSFQAA